MTKINPISYTFSLKLAIPDPLLESLNDTLAPVGFVFEQERVSLQKRTIHNVNTATITLSLIDSNCFLMDFCELSLLIQECFQAVKLTDSKAVETLMWNSVTGLLRELDANIKLLTFHKTTDRKTFLSYPVSYNKLVSLKVGSEIEFSSQKTNKTSTGEIVAIIERGQCLADVLEKTQLHANCKNVRNIHTIQDKTKFVVGACCGKGNTYTVNIVSPENIIAVH